MIEILIKEDMNDTKGNAVATDTKFTVTGRGDIIASQVEHVLDMFYEQLPNDIMCAALDSFIERHMDGGGDYE